jgi:hypothetical protein
MIRNRADLMITLTAINLRRAVPMGYSMISPQSGHRELENTLDDRFAKVPISGEGDTRQRDG